MQVAIPLFPHFTALDGIGPYEVLQRIPEPTGTGLLLAGLIAAACNSRRIRQ